MKFLNCNIDVSKKVLEPRQETEFWVGKAIKESPTRAGKIECLDLFAGSGCIGIAVLKNLKDAVVDFADISGEALEQIRINLELNKVSSQRYKIIKSDIFGSLKSKKYDIIFANPPYVALDRIKEVQKEVLEKDPRLALFSGREGMDAIRKFLPGTAAHLSPKGKVFMEFDPGQKKEIKKIADRCGLSVSFHKDQFNKYRWLTACKD